MLPAAVRVVGGRNADIRVEAPKRAAAACDVSWWCGVLWRCEALRSPLHGLHMHFSERGEGEQAPCSVGAASGRTHHMHWGWGGTYWRGQSGLIGHGMVQLAVLLLLLLLLLVLLFVGSVLHSL